MVVFDCIIIGGGPAGLSAAVYMARFNRSVLVIDKQSGRSSYPQINENYLGFPEGIHIKKLKEIGRVQAENYGAKIVEEEIIDIEKNNNNNIFEVKGTKDNYQSKAIILATGVEDQIAHVGPFKEYLGISLFLCLTCDGYKIKNKKVVVFGREKGCVETALQLLNFTDKLVFVTNTKEGERNIPQKERSLLEKFNIPFYEDEISGLEGENGQLKKVILKSGEIIEAEFLFSHQEPVPNTKLAEKLGVKVNEEGYIMADKEQRTNIELVYAAGDLTRRFSHQVIAAAHEGAMASQSANFDLYSPEQQGK